VGHGKGGGSAKGAPMVSGYLLGQSFSSLPHQENSIRLAWSGASGRSGMSGRFGCQKSSFSHFYQNFYIATRTP